MGQQDDLRPMHGSNEPLRQNSAMQDLRQPQEFYQGNNREFSGVARIKEIEAEMITIANMQNQLVIAINDLTRASVINQIENKVVDAIFYIRSFLSISSARRAIQNRVPAAVTSENGYRLTVIKNSDDFLKKTANKEFIDRSVNSAISSFRETLEKKTIEIIARRMINKVANSSEIELFLDAINSGTGTLDRLYEINDALNREYNILARERSELLRR